MMELQALHGFTHFESNDPALSVVDAIVELHGCLTLMQTVD